MPIIVKPKFNGESGSTGSQSSHEIPYIVKGASSLAAAVAEVIREAPKTYTAPDGKQLVQSGVGYDELNSDAGAYEIAIRYGSSEFNANPAGTVRITFDTTGASAKVTQSKETKQVRGLNAAGAVVDLATTYFQNTIGNQGDEVEGVELPYSEFSFTVTKVFDTGEAPDLGVAWRIGSHTNTGEIKFRDTVTGLLITLNAGECLFLNCRGGEAREDGKIEIAFNFKAGPNLTGLTIGTITGINKGAHDYLWVRYAETVVTGPPKMLIRKPVAAVVDRVFDPADLKQLKCHHEGSQLNQLV